MYIDQILQKKLAINKSLHQVNQSEVKKESAQSNALDIHEIAVYLSPLSFVIGWVAFFLILRKIRTFLDSKMVFSVRGLHQVPCKNCQFYCNNHYLKCAVNPSIVLTEEAKDCSEYSPKKNKFF